MSIDWRGRPAWAEIDLDAIRHNVARLARLARSAELAAAVKANAYGHGAVQVARAALDAGAQRLAVACVDEAVELRRAGITAPILVLGYAPHTEASTIVDHRITPMVASRQIALALSAEAQREGITQPIHLKVDTGMGRYGVLPEEAVAFARFLDGLPHLELEGVYTHFACADAPDKAAVRRQWRTFLGVLAALSAANVPVPYRHCANSAAVLDLSETHLDLVRPGLAIYGLNPGEHTRKVGLRPALTLKSRIGRARWLPEGTTVSYGGTWLAQRRSRIALVPIGYGDGVPRHLSNRGQALVRGRRVPFAGRVCMDSLMLDVTEVPEAQQDDEVVLIGRQGREEITAEEVAGWAETINYEIFTRLSQRLARLYLSSGEILETTTLVAEEAEPAPLPL